MIKRNKYETNIIDTLSSFLAKEIDGNFSIHPKKLFCKVLLENDVNYSDNLLTVRQVTWPTRLAVATTVKIIISLQQATISQHYNYLDFVDNF